MGGDKFIVVISDIVDAEDITKLVQKIFDIFRESSDLDGHAAFVSTSISIALYPDDGANKETLIKHADAAMYNAKQSGQNQYGYYTAESGSS